MTIFEKDNLLGSMVKRRYQNTNDLFEEGNFLSCSKKEETFNLEEFDHFWKY